MTRASRRRASTSSRARNPSGDRPAIALWHAAWACGCALLALGLEWWAPDLARPLVGGLLAMALPGVVNLFLLGRDGAGARMTALTVWTLVTTGVSALSGGLTGDLWGFVFAPLAAALALGGSGRLAAGVGGTAVAALTGLVTPSIAASIKGPVERLADLGPMAAGLTLAAAVMAIAVSQAQAARTLRSAAAGTRRLEAVLADQPGLTVVLDPEGNALAAYGAPPTGIRITPLFANGLLSSVLERDRPAVNAALARAMSGSAQIPFVPRAARDRRIVLSLRRGSDGPGGARLIAQLCDGTAQYAEEIGLEAARAEAEAQNAGKTRFLANMSHELRTPLNAVLGFSEIMRRGLFGPLPEKYAGYAVSIHEAGEHLLDLINDVLDVSKIEAERYQLSLEVFDAREPVAAAIALIRPQADDKGLSVYSVTPPAPTPIIADRRAFKQVAVNLLSNAVKFTPKGGSITVTVETVGSSLELMVADTGVGIAPEDLDRLGRPFEQAGGVEQRARGTGLGLSLARSLVELHHGRMSIESTLGEGTAVVVRLPIAALDVAPASGGTRPSLSVVSG